MFAWSEPGRHLLEWMDVVPEIAKRMAERVRIVLNKTYLSRNVDEAAQAPILEPLYFSCVVFWRRLGGTKVSGKSDRKAQQNSFERAAGQDDDG